MEIIVVDDLSNALRLYDLNKNIKTAWCLNLKHNIKKEERERETLVGISGSSRKFFQGVHYKT